MKLPILSSVDAKDTTEFVRFWSDQWTVKDKAQDEKYYTPLIGRPLTCVRLLRLFTWKNQTKLSKGKAQTVKRFIERLPELRKLPPQTEAKAFLEIFRTGGAVWRIFLLHCWSHSQKTKKYPIYDQHVHRAMTFICEQELEEIGNWSDEQKIEAYLKRYIDFFEKFGGNDSQKTDQALMVFGRFIKAFRLPPRYGYDRNNS